MYKTILEKDEDNKESLSLSGEYSSKILDNNMNTESMEGSPKKYPNLCIAVSENFYRKVFVHDSTVVQHFDEITTTQNIDKIDKHKLENEEYSSDFNINGKQTNCDSPLKQLSPVKDHKKRNTGYEEECKDLIELIIKMKENNNDRKEMRDSKFEMESCSESDDELKKRHPNRRLQTERRVSGTESGNRKCKELRTRHSNYFHERRKRHKPSHRREDDKFGKTDQSNYFSEVKRPKMSSNVINVAQEIKQENPVMENKAQSAAELWSEVLSTPELWITEYNNIDIDASRKIMFEPNYQQLLTRYMNCDIARKLDNQYLIFWETRYQEKLMDPNNLHFLEYYIPPAQVELFHLQLTDELSCIECLSKVCENRQWPQPVYTLLPLHKATKGFVYTCQLKAERFTPSELASNHQLAQELSAHLCLDWLGLSRSRAPEPVEALQPGSPIAASISKSISL